MEGQRTTAFHLPQTSDTGTHAETAPLPVFTRFSKQVVVSHLQWTRPHQAHVSFKHIEKLWQFVNARFTQKLANRSKARIILDFENRPSGFSQVLNFTQLLLRIHYHGTEFINCKSPFVEANPLLHKKHGPGRGELDQHQGDE